jgi:hypothetical protein
MGMSGLLALPALFTIGFVAQIPRPVISTSDHPLGSTQPFGAADFLRANAIQGRLYTPLWWGSYFSWELYPEILVSCDGRNVTLFTPQTVADNLAFYLDDNPDLDIPVRTDADFLVVPTDAPVLPRVREDGRWAVLYEDGDAVLFVSRLSWQSVLQEMALKPGASQAPAAEGFPWRRPRRDAPPVPVSL